MLHACETSRGTARCPLCLPLLAEICSYWRLLTSDPSTPAPPTAFEPCKNSGLDFPPRPPFCLSAAVSRGRGSQLTSSFVSLPWTTRTSSATQHNTVSLWRNVRVFLLCSPLRNYMFVTVLNWTSLQKRNSCVSEPGTAGETMTLLRPPCCAHPVPATLKIYHFQSYFTMSWLKPAVM